MEIVQTGLYWLKDLSEEQIVAIKNAYSYPDPKEPTKVFYTFIEHNGKLGIPWGDRQKAIRVLGDVLNITDKRINTPFNNPCEFVGHALRDYQEEAFKEVEAYFASGGSVFNLSGSPRRRQKLHALIPFKQAKSACIDNSTSFDANKPVVPRGLFSA